MKKILQLSLAFLTFIGCDRVFNNPWDSLMIEQNGGPPKSTYILSFDSNGGTGSMSEIAVLEGETIILPVSNMTKTGSLFYGWSTGETGPVVYDDGAEFTMGKSNIKLFAQYLDGAYSISFNPNGGSGVMTPQVMLEGASGTLKPNTFTFEGYTFTGWATSAGGSVAYANGANYTMGTANVTLYAKWTPNTYTVSFNSNDGTGSMSPQSFTTGETKALSNSTFTRSGYTFAGWATSANGSMAYANGANYAMGTANVTLYAKWNINSYTVSFNANDGIGTMADQTFEYNETKSLTANSFTRIGYTFAGWATTSGGSVTYSNGTNYTMGSANVTLYAKWTPNTYTVSFNSNGGTGSMSPQSFTTGGTKALSNCTFTRSGYTFAGWATSAGGSVAYANGANYTMGTANVTLYAKWTFMGYVSPNIGNLMFVPAGRFQRDATATNISEVSEFRMSQHEITRAQFLGIMGTDPSTTSKSSGINDPVQNLNWYHAIAFCNKLSLAEGLQPVYTVTISGTPVNWTTLVYTSIPTDTNVDWNQTTATWSNNGYRLPNEMEWMWAAMGAPLDGQSGGTNTTGYLKAFAGSTGSNSINDYAWYSSISFGKTHPRGSLLGNEIGLYDMSGNVWEWCWDRHGSYPTGPLTDYRGASPPIASRIYRGGSYFEFTNWCALSWREYGDEGGLYINVGFRVVRN